MRTDHSNERPILGYATPPPAGGFASAPASVIMLVAVLVPGLSSAILRGVRGIVTLGSLLLTLVLAFWFFGPFWGEVLFRNSPLREAGLYPFLGTWVAICLTSVSLALRDRRHVRRPYIPMTNQPDRGTPPQVPGGDAGGAEEPPGGRAADGLRLLS